MPYDQYDSFVFLSKAMFSRENGESYVPMMVTPFNVWMPTEPASCIAFPKLRAGAHQQHL